MQESNPPPGLDYEALAKVLDETVASTPAAPVYTALPAGTELRYFGDYLLEEEIARGGMGIVYRAVQLSLDRPVAVKVLRDGAFAGGQEIERFKREASSAAALRHRNIVGIHEIGENDGRHFFSMDYVPGQTLGQLLKEGPLPSKKAAVLMVKIASAIHHAHAAGVLHRDLKPSNIIMDAAGEPMVTDFGLAKHDAADMGLTLSGQVLGTPAYMPPEQAEGQAKNAGPHTDVYGLGALFYHLLAGRAPFTADSHVAVLAQVTHDDPVSVRLLNPSIPRDLENVCAKAMAKEPARRYTSAQALADDLQRFLDGKPVLARPVSSVEKLWRWARRHRALAASLAAVVLLTFGVLITIAVSRHRIEGLRQDAVQRLYASDMRLALQNIAEDKYGAAVPLLDRYAAPDKDDLRGFEWYLARHLSRSDETAALEPLTGQVTAVAWSPDGRWLAAAAQNLRVWKMTEGRTVLRHTAEAPAYALAFSPDGTRLAMSLADGEVAVCESGAPDKKLFTGKFPVSPQAIAWRTDGTALEVMAPQIHWRWEVGKSEPVRVGPLGGLARVVSLNAAARRGLYILAGPPGGDAWQVAVRDTEHGAPFATVRTPNDRMPKCMACSADNRWLVIGDFAGRVVLLETPFAERTWGIQAHRSMVDQVALSADAALVASAGDHVIHLRGREQGALQRTLRGHHAKVSALTFSPDGAWLLSGDTAGAVKRWSVALPPAAAESIPETVMINPSADGAALCWNVNAQQVRFLPPGGTSLTFDVDSRGKERRVFHRGVIFQASGFAGEKNPLTIYSMDGPPAEWSIPGKLTACSPDGQWITYTDSASGSLMLAGRTNPRPPVVIAGGWLVSPPSFSADSRRCAVGDQRGRSRVFDSATGAEICTIAAHRGAVRGKSFSADGTVLATAGLDGVAKLWDLPSGQLRREFRGSADTLWSVALSPDGHRLAAGTGESTIILWDTATGLETGTISLAGSPGPVEFLVFAPDGAALIANGRVLAAPRKLR
jgi:WD40 repeat protein